MENEAPARSGKAGPVFIVGMNGSGTTMLLDCLDNHPDLYGFPIETKILPFFLSRLPRYGDLADDENYLRLWNDIRNIVYFRAVNHGQPPPLPVDWRDRERSFGGVVGGVIGYFAEREDKARWCEKSPMYALHIDAFAEAFPDASFIHVIRDGRDCAHSFHRRWGYTPARTMLRWKTTIRCAREVGRTLGNRYLEIRYEDVTNAPEAEMQRVCAFLGVRYTDAVLHLGRPRKGEKMISRRIVPNTRSWRDALQPADVAELEGIGGKLLHELGYETSLPEADWVPPRVHQAIWRHKDNLRRTYAGFRRMVKTSNWRRRRLMLETLVTNIRHKTHVGIQ